MVGMTGFEPAAFWSRTRRAQLFYWGSLSPNLRVSSEYRTISSSKYRLDAPRSWVFTIHSLIQRLGLHDLVSEPSAYSYTAWLLITIDLCQSLGFQQFTGYTLWYYYHKGQTYQTALHPDAM